jgi:putative ABC transport system ATP-binding protein
MADEPTGSLDPKTAHQTFDLMRTLIEEARSSLVMVTHDHGLAKECNVQMQLENACLRAVSA